MATFVAATGLPRGELIAFEQRDIDRDARVVYVGSAFRNGRIKWPFLLAGGSGRARAKPDVNADGMASGVESETQA